MPIDASTLTSQEQITAIYVAYYDRAPDPAGLQFWVDQLEGGRSLEQIATDFTTAAETIQKYPYFESPELASGDAFITSIYVNLFGRAPDAAGLAFWTDQLESGTTPVGEIILAILEGAQDEASGGFPDSETITNKIDVGIAWAEAAANAGIGTLSTPIAVDLGNGQFDVLDADSFSSATSILDGVTGDSPSVDAALAAVEEYFGEAVNVGETFNLTTSIDNVDVTTFGTVDTIRGALNDDGTTDNDTFSSGDFIGGNGLTEVSLSLIDVDGGSADFVEMEGVNSLNFRGAGETGTVTFDAASYGTDLNNFTLSGGDNSDVVVDDVEFDEGALTFEIAEGTTGDLDVDGMQGDWSLTADLSATGSGSASLISDIGGAGITAIAGEDADIDFDADIGVTTTSANATIDAVDVGDVSVVSGLSADVEISMSLSADANSSGDAVIGDVTFGMIDLSAGVSGSVDVTIDRNASADDGNATIGNLTVGDISFDLADSSDISLDMAADASVSGVGDASIGDTTIGDVTIVGGDNTDSWTIDINNTADADTGIASIGNLTMGNVSMVMGESHDSSDFWIDRSASVSVSGDATVGDIMIGSISGVLGDFGSETEFTINQSADAASGNASVGAIMIGDISFDMGEDTDIEFSVTNSASADNGGDATVGDVAIGNIDLTQDSGSTFDLDISMNADASGSGNGIVGNLTVGDITSVMDIDTDLSISISVDATGTGTMTAIGDVSIGNLTLSGPVAISASAEFDLDLDSDGAIGAVTVGAMDVDFLADSTFDYEVAISAGTSSDGVVGAVLLGDVDIVADDITYEVDVSGDLTAGVTIGDVMLSGEDIVWQGISIDASADIGDVTIGDVMLDAATNLTVDTGISISATGDVGSVTVGDVAIDFANGETFDINVYAGDDIGDVALGNVDITASVTASATTSVFGSVELQVTGDADVGNISVGDVSILNSGVGANYGSAYFTLDVDAGTGDSVGNVTVGDIDLTSVALGFDNGFFGVFGAFIADIGGNASDVGDVVFGNITLNATAENVADNADADNDEAQPFVGIFADNGSTVSSMLVGDVDITLTNSVDDSSAFTAGQEYNVAAATVSVTSDSAITVGDINLSAVNDSAVDVQGGVGTNGLFDFNLFFGTGGDEDITFGDITVVGGGVDTSGADLDNLGNLTGWLATNGDTVTVGDIDYSGYTGASTIDVSGAEGAANITAGSGGADITVNTTQNLVTLGAGDDTVIYEADEDSGTTYADIDKISEFVSGSDLIDFSATAGITNVDVAGAFADYDTFLVAAQNAMSFDSGIDVFVGNDGTNTYVAIESDDDASQTIDYAIELTGVTGLSAADFVV